MSKSSSQDPLDRSSAEIGFEVSLAILMGLSVMFSNLLVVFVINKDSRLHNVTNMLINNLALTDITMATISMPFWIVCLYTGSWIFSQKLCQIAGSVLTILAYTSIFTMGLIAINRYLQVVKPILYRKVFPGKRAARLYCVLVWLVATVIAIPFLGGWVGVSYNIRASICTAESSVYRSLIVGTFITGIMMTIFYCYFKIYKAVKESTENLNSHDQENGVSTINNSRHFDVTDINILKTCFTVACAFFITWSPISFFAARRTDLPQKVYTASTYLMFSSSLLNPFIYGIMNPRFKQAFKRALQCGCNGNANTDDDQARNEARREHSGEIQAAA